MGDTGALSILLFFYSEKATAPHSSTLAWKIPWTEESGRLQSMGPQRVGRDWATSLSVFTSMHWRRKWQPTPVFLPGESQGWGSLVGCRLWGRTESDTTEVTCSSSSSFLYCSRPTAGQFCPFCLPVSQSEDCPTHFNGGRTKNWSLLVMFLRHLKLAWN